MTSSPRYLAQLDQLRGVAAALVVVAHLMGGFLASQQHAWPPFELLSRYVLDPLVIVQDMGWLGVAIFFLISGYVVTLARQREAAWAFGVRRILRIYPPLIATVLIMWAIQPTGLQSVGEGITTGDWLLSLTLANYVTPGFVPIVGVAWTLAIEMLFYLLVAALGWLRGGLVWIMPATIIAACLAAIVLSRSLGDAFFLLSVNLSYLPLLVLGQLVMLWRTGQLRWWVAGLLSIAAWAVFVRGLEVIQPGFLEPAAAYGPSLLVAGIAFAAALAIEGRVAPIAPLRVLAARSYTLYLVHGPVGLSLLALLVVRLDWPYELGLLVALLGVAAATELVHRVAERPGIALGRLLTRRAARPPAEPVPVVTGSSSTW